MKTIQEYVLNNNIEYINLIEHGLFIPYVGKVLGKVYAPNCENLQVNIVLLSCNGEEERFTAFFNMIPDHIRELIVNSIA